MDITTTLSAFVELGARWVLWMLLGLSVAALAVLLERILFFTSTRENVDELRQDTARFLEREALGEAVRRLEERPSIEARLTAAALRDLPAGPSRRDSDTSARALERLTAARALEKLRLERGVSFLGTLAAAAPFVGLLGTVIGIVSAFQELAHSQGRLTGALMSEIGEALVATAVGLLVALPALAAFNGLQRLIHVRLVRGDAIARELLTRWSTASEAEGR
jgi:biopolymer transport protein ExbB